MGRGGEGGEVGGEARAHLARLEEVDPARAELLLVEGEARHRRLLGVEDGVRVARRPPVGAAHQVDVVRLQRRRPREELEDLVDGAREGQPAQPQHAAVAGVLAHRRAVALAHLLPLGGGRLEALDVPLADLLPVRLEHLGHLVLPLERDERLARRVVEHRDGLGLHLQTDRAEEIANLARRVAPRQPPQARHRRHLLDRRLEHGARDVEHERARRRGVLERRIARLGRRQLALNRLRR